MVGIYRIRNILNNKCYYGSSKNINKRWNRHKNELLKNKHNNIKLQRAWNKYKENNFIFEIVELCNIDDLLIKEQIYLNKKPEYNIGLKSSGGDNISNNPNKDIIINKIKKTLLDRYNNMTDDEIKEKYSKPKELNSNWKGGKTYCECGNRINSNSKCCIKCIDRKGENNPFYGKKHKKETIEKFKIIAKNRMKKPSNSKKVYVDGEIYESGGDVSNIFKISRGLVNYRCKSDKWDWYFLDDKK